MEKPFILKDGKLILRKPINLDEVPSPPPAQQSNIAKQLIWGFIGLLLIGVIIIGIGLNIPSAEAGWYEDTVNWLKELLGFETTEEAENLLKITPSTLTICKDKICTLTIYSGIKFIYEDEIWKKREEAKSFKDSGIECVVKSDGVNIVKCLDWNETSRTAEFSSKTQDLIPLRKYSVGYNKTTGESYRIYDEAFETNLDLNILNSKEVLVLKANFGDVIEFGEHSTELILNESDTENKEDSYTHSGFGTRNHGAKETLIISEESSNIKRTYIKFNISAIPSGQIIDEAYLHLYKHNQAGNEPENVSIYHVLNLTWEEGDGIDEILVDAWPNLTHNSQPCGEAFDNANDCNLTAMDTIEISNITGIWDVFNITNALKQEYADTNINFSLAIKFDNTADTQEFEYRSKEYTDNVSQRPYLNITYTQAPVPPVVEIWLPTNNSYSNSESANFTYNVSDPNVDAIPNCTLWLQHDSGAWESNKTDESITAEINQSINISTAYENLKWLVACYDENSEQGNSTTYNYSREVFYPVVNLQFPENLSVSRTRDVNFTYNVSIPAKTVDICYLWLNDKLNSTDTSIYNPPASPIGEWLFEGTADDTSGNDNDGVVTGATLTTGFTGQGYLIDGINDKIVVANDVSLNFGANTDFSLCAWIKPLNFVGIDKFLAKDDGTKRYLMFTDAGGNLGVLLDDDTTQKEVLASATLTANIWTHTCATFDRDGLLTLYKNAGSIGTPSDISTVGDIDNVEALGIGSRGSGANPFNGTIDEVAIYNRVLTTDEITDLYESGLHAINQTFNITLNNTQNVNWLVECENNEGYKANSSKNVLLFNNPPTTPTTLSPANETIIARKYINLSCSDSTDPDGHTINYEFWNGTAVVDMELAQNSTISTYTLNFTTPNPYHWKCRANDGAEHSDYSPIRVATYAQLYPNCTAANDTSAVAFNFTFAAENNTQLYNVTFDDAFTFWGSDRTINQTITFEQTIENQTLYCISPVNITLNTNAVIAYEKTVDTAWNLRHFILDNYLARGNNTNITLYLLTAAEGVYVTFQVVNTAGQPLVDVFFTAEREVAGTWKEIYSQFTDDAGSVVPFLDPDYSHRFTFIKPGYDVYTTTLTPTQTLYTITLGEVAVVTNETISSRGITFNIFPVNATLNNNTIYNFTFNISSANYALDSAGFTLTNSTDDTLNTTSCTIATGCMSSVRLDVLNNNYIIMNYYWVIDGVTYQGGKRMWYVYSTYEGGYSMMKIFEDAELLGAGFNDFTKAIMSFVIIICIVGVATLKFNLHNYSEGAVVLLIAFLTAGLDFVGFLPEIPKSIPHFIPIMMFIIGIGYVIYEFKR